MRYSIWQLSLVLYHRSNLEGFRDSDLAANPKSNMQNLARTRRPFIPSQWGCIVPLSVALCAHGQLRDNYFLARRLFFSKSSHVTRARGTGTAATLIVVTNAKFIVSRGAKKTGSRLHRRGTEPRVLGCVYKTEL